MLIVLIHAILDVLLSLDALLTLWGPRDLFSHGETFTKLLDLSLISDGLSLDLDHGVSLVLLGHILVISARSLLSIHWRVRNLGSALQFRRYRLFRFILG
jgi:hypothetical protein